MQIILIQLKYNLSVYNNITNPKKDPASRSDLQVNFPNQDMN